MLPAESVNAIEGKEDKYKIGKDNSLTDRYNILSTIKSDFKGNVYLAEHKVMGVRRVIKEAALCSVYKESLMREAFILGSLNCDFIPVICDAEEYGDSFYIVEEYIQGKNLYDYIREKGILNQDEAISYGIKLAKIIEFLHSGNSFKVCHLDIQPKNIIINNGNVYLVDFGNSESNMNFEESGTIMATKGFAPPEQYCGMFMPDIFQGFKADIYGFGAVLLYMLTGCISEPAGAVYGEVTKLLEEKGVCVELSDIIAEATSRNASYRQVTISILKKQLMGLAKTDASVHKHVHDKQCVISVAGIKHGAGATYTALALVGGFLSRNINVSYEENNDGDSVREMAKLNDSIKYDKGYFVYGRYRLKPMYGENIRIFGEETVIVRDEGVISSNRTYGDILVVVMNGDALSRYALKKALPLMEAYGTWGIKVFGIFNMCSESIFRREAGSISVTCRRIPFGSEPFKLTEKEIKQSGEIADYIWGKNRKREDIKDKKEGTPEWRERVKNHWNNIRKKW